jgi:hypothetical protein
VAARSKLGHDMVATLRYECGKRAVGRAEQSRTHSWRGEYLGNECEKENEWYVQPLFH